MILRHPIQTVLRYPDQARSERDLKLLSCQRRQYSRSRWTGKQAVRGSSTSAKSLNRSLIAVDQDFGKLLGQNVLELFPLPSKKLLSIIET